MELNYRGNRYQQRRAEESSSPPPSSPLPPITYRGVPIRKNGAVESPKFEQEAQEKIFQELSDTGIKHYQEGHYQQALEDLSQALRYIPQASGLWAIRAECLAQLNRYDEAILSMDYAIRLEPSNQILQRDRQLLVTVGGMHQIKM
ncbi:MAG: tetratricopeptide repeat protein [Elainellaceae cyanobacterium]